MKNFQNVEFDDSVLKSIEALVEQGDTKAMLKLGDCYFTGNSIVPSKDINKAAELFHMAALKGEAVGYEHLFRMCDMDYVLKTEGLSPLVSYDLRRDYITKAHEMGDDEATLFLGFAYLNGYFGEVDASKAKSYFTILKSHDYVLDEEGYGITLNQLLDACDTLDGFIDPKTYLDHNIYDDDLSYSHQLKLAKEGNLISMYNIGIMLETGKGAKRDDMAAFNWYFKAAKLGCGEACLELALSTTLRMKDCVLDDHYTNTLNPNIGNFFLIKGAEYGDPDCMMRLFNSYTLGDMGVYDTRLGRKVLDYMVSHNLVDSEDLDELYSYCK